MAEQERDYEIGYGMPPKANQFKPGQSGNPQGRPKGSKNFRTDLVEECSETVRVTENGKTQILTKQRALLKTTFNRALKGDVRAIRLLLDWIDNFVVFLSPQPGLGSPSAGSGQ